jgi:YihY family inner membrane protein
MNLVERALRRADAAQQHHTAPAIALGVVKKYGDDNGGNLSVQLTYAMFMTVFPLLLLAVTILGITLADDPSLRQRVLDSAFGQFPVVGQQLAHNIHAFKRRSTFGLVVGILGLVYGTTSLAQSGLFAMAQIWNVPGASRPNFVARLGRSLAFLLLLAVGLVITTALTGFGTFGSHNPLWGALAEVVAVVINVGLYLGAFRLLTPKQVATRDLVVGAVIGGVVWTILQAFGGYVVGHYLRGSSALYGTFGLVLGLMAWIYLGAQITLYAAEVNTVLFHRLWPRGLVQPPLTEADQNSIALQAIQNQRRPEQEVRTRFNERPMSQDRFRQNGYRVEEGPGLEFKVPDKQEQA